ncbi:PucR family transcriptional regulator [Streptomyces sp. NPDC048604]|uniref:PucR family transcriptional regulator n=1 Tax=Streptomyces sp. NPDC048604 TaxID=3365578 RepID=UPI00371D47C8
MTFTLADLVARPELRLSVTAGAGALDRPVLAAHASELVRPGQWLQGGELLMTIGLLLPMEAEACRAYVEDVRASGASALALGLGAALPHQSAPPVLVAAAEAAGLPLLTVADEVPFIAVTKAVFAARAAEQRAALENAFETQRRLTAAAASGRGLAPTLEAWTRATGVPVVVADPVGRVLAGAAGAVGAAGGAVDAGLPPGAEELIRRVATLQASAVSVEGGAYVEVQPLGARRLRGVLVLGGEPGAETRLLVSGLVALLSLELERRHLADEPERRRRAALLGRLLDEEGSAETAGDALAAAGLALGAVRAVVVDAATPEDAAEVAAGLALALPGGLTRTAGGVVEAVAAEDTDVRELLERFAPGCPAGIGAPVAPEAARTSLRQASGLLEVSRRSGRPALAQRSHSSRLLLGLGERDALAGYADTVLGPLDVADPAGELVETLATWLDSGCSWDETGRRLGLHRHTVRNRLDKAMRLTGRRLDDGDDRFDLWLATRARRAAL